MYGLTDLNNKNECEIESLDSSTSLTCSRNDTLRNNLKKLLHSYRFHLIIIGLVVIDCIIVVIELLIDVQLYQSKAESDHSDHSDPTQSHSTQHSSAHIAAEVLHYTSIAILCIFATEICLKLYAFRAEFFTQIFEVFDAFIVLTSLILDIVFIHHEDILRFIGLVIVLRLWRIIRVIHGIVISVRTPLEHSLEKEKKKKEHIERELAEMHLYVNSLELEITSLRSLLDKNNVVTDVPQTYLKLDRKI